MLRQIRNTCFGLSLGLIVSGLLTSATGITAIISVPTLLGSGLAAGAIGFVLEVLGSGRRP
jgi:hypothetical protein